MKKPILQISATPMGVTEVAIRCEHEEGLRLYSALLPAIETINSALSEIFSVVDSHAATPFGPFGRASRQ